jgi:hypothetical protein
MDKTFAKIFNFKHAKVLFKQPNGPNLYKVNALSAEEFFQIADSEDYSESNV